MAHKKVIISKLANGYTISLYNTQPNGQEVVTKMIAPTYAAVEGLASNHFFANENQDNEHNPE